ncbi:hypothetical protein SAY87_031599 [Trapa incisa]|uniref:AP-4 complex subunit epsilon n=1 Tax=Trapa incisa TaxID=236973 RepID=A0AAN7KY08_9MYRT|nr:hypothetical protein SAY87_031599 [Trapa incisa]
MDTWPGTRHGLPIDTGWELAMGSQGGFGQSKEFLELVKSIGETRSKSDPDFVHLKSILMQTMNRIFEYAGYLVDIKVAHNLMRLIDEGFGEDNETADSQLRSSALEISWFMLFLLQVICWVLGEFGTADGNYSVSYISGKLCDVAEAYSSDENVKAYAITALMKIYAFEIVSGRRLDILPECQSLIEELSLIEAHSVESSIPSDASCEDIEQSLQNGAQPYIPEEQRSGTIDISSFSNQEGRESSMHTLKFEAYELPKPPAQSRAPLPVPNISTKLVPVPEPSHFARETNSSPSIPSVSSSGSPELKATTGWRSEEVGYAMPSYSSSPPSSSGASPSTAKGASQAEPAASLTSKSRDSYKDLKKEVEITPEKQKLSASLFGSSLKSDKRTCTSHKTTRADTLSTDKSTGSRSSAAPTTETKVPPHPLPNLLDLGEQAVTAVASSVDPFMQLEGLFDDHNGSGLSRSQ